MFFQSVRDTVLSHLLVPRFVFGITFLSNLLQVPFDIGIIVEIFSLAESSDVKLKVRKMYRPEEIEKNLGKLAPIKDLNLLFW
jgi:hypothetical protein